MAIAVLAGVAFGAGIQYFIEWQRPIEKWILLLTGILMVVFAFILILVLLLFELPGEGEESEQAD